VISRTRDTTGYDPAEGATSTPGADAELVGAFVAPRTSDDLDGRGRGGLVVGLTLFAPLDADLRATDGITIADEGPADGDYRIVGELAPWKNPLTGWRAGVTAALERTAG
jgi:hypothetical protein